jgi:hypothetical protein
MPGNQPRRAGVKRLDADGFDGGMVEAARVCGSVAERGGKGGESP